MFEQIDLFSNSDNLYKIRKPLRIVEFFAGIGFQRIGIQRVFPNAQSWKICEWAIPSIIAYDVIHGKKEETCDYINDKGWLVDFLLNKGVSADYNVPAEKKQLQRMPLDKLNRIYQAIVRTNNLVNIMNVRGEDLEIVDTDKYEYCCSYSFPCQDLSLSGKQAGMSVSQKEGGTRSGLVWEFLRIIKECKEKPQLLLMENVPQIHSKKVNDCFYVLQLELQKLGYKNIWKDMNSKDYGIPQSRNRTFMLSIYDKNADLQLVRATMRATMRELTNPNIPMEEKRRNLGYYNTITSQAKIIVSACLAEISIEKVRPKQIDVIAKK